MNPARPPRRASHGPIGLVVMGILTLSGCDGPSATTRPTSAAQPDRTSQPAAIATQPGGDAPASPSVNPARGSLVQTIQQWTFISPRGRLITTPNYRLFTTLPDGFILQRLPRFAETALAHYSTAFGPLPRPTQPMETYFLATRQQWARMTQHLMGKQAELFLRIQRGGYASNAKGVFFEIGRSDSFSLMAHEGWHQYVQATFKEPLPIWLDEGLATTMEGFQWGNAGADEPIFVPELNRERLEMLRTAVSRKKLLSLPDLLNTSPQQQLVKSDEGTLIYYAQVWALALYLQRGDNGRHSQQLSALLQDAARGDLGRMVAASFDQRGAMLALQGRRGPLVYQTYFDKDLAVADKSYQQFIRQLATPGAASR